MNQNINMTSGFTSKIRKDFFVHIASAVITLGIILFPLLTFAQTSGVNINSNTNFATSSYGCSTINKNLYFGSSGVDVINLQQFLKNQGYLSANVTGYFGFATMRAVAKYQTNVGIRSTGYVGVQTRNQINSMCGTTNPNPDQTPVYNFVPSDSCKTWFDGCNSCARSTVGGPAACTQRACFAAGKGYCTSYFDNTDTTNNNLPPTISGISGPTSLNVNQSGTFSVTANDPNNQQLTYKILWGDENLNNNMYASNSPNSFSQTSTFTHQYSNSGTYTVTITVTNNSGKTSTATTNVQVTGNNNTVCYELYQPVCGQPPVPSCIYSQPACYIATPGPKTYSNSCFLNAAGASYLYQGQCTNGN